MQNSRYSQYRLYDQYRENPTLRNSGTHHAEHGNLHVDVLPVDIQSDWQDGELVIIDELFWDQTYRSIKIIGEKVDAGLSIDLGVLDMDTHVAYPSLFGADIFPDRVGVPPVASASPNSTAAAGIKSHELLAFPFRMHEDLNLGIRAGLLATLKGNVTSGDRFWIEIERLNFGGN